MIMNKTERFKKLRSLPCCNCGSTPCDVAHSNSHEDGKGLGLKASDFKTVSLCRTCHQKFDSFAMGLNREQAKTKFTEWLTKTNMALGYKDESAF